METTDQLLAQIHEMKGRNAFRKYIEYIRFPYFRNLEKDTRIDFDFPLTVFVGQNGSGKSSTLHALFGAPRNKSIGTYWFSTDVDPIEEVSSGGDRHCFIYAYKERSVNLEVLKTRIHNASNLDYWETSRPVVGYGMQILPGGQRNPPLEKNVEYIDFRSELSAFDKYFHFRTPNITKKIRSKQDYLRKYSSFLRQIIDNPTRIIRRHNINQNRVLRQLLESELESISFILGKRYSAGRLIEHKLFQDWGFSVVFQTPHHSYSEAFAGSGEMAVVRLVLKVLDAERYSLILLDEPEVSLHPGAQKRLMQFILWQIKQKQLQVVISTHSPNIIEGLPSNAIKVFSQMPDGKFNVKSEITPNEAFYHLELSNPSKKTIIVEDNTAKMIVDEVLNTLGEDIASQFEVTYYTGGHSVLKCNFISIYSQESLSNKYVLFDGDQRKPHFDPDSVAMTEHTNERFKLEITNQTGCNVEFRPDGNSASGGNTEQEKLLREKYLKYYLNHVFYLPLMIPEDIVWSDDLARKQLASIDKETSFSRVQEGSDNKEKFYLLTLEMTGDSANMETFVKLFTKHWVDQKDENFDSIQEVINIMRQ